jgi:hypothetical protein
VPVNEDSLCGKPVEILSHILASLHRCSKAKNAIWAQNNNHPCLRRDAIFHVSRVVQVIISVPEGQNTQSFLSWLALPATMVKRRNAPGCNLWAKLALVSWMYARNARMPADVWVGNPAKTTTQKEPVFFVS